MWSCPECGETNASAWRDRVLYGVLMYMTERGIEFRFVTLTLGGNNRTRLNSIQAWREVWPRLYARHYRKHGARPYVLIPEMHRNGVVHLHAIIATDEKQRWWKDNCYAVGGGYMAKSIAIDQPSNILVYMAKYMTKNNAVKRWPDNYRRVRTSHDWPSPPEPEWHAELDWSVKTLETITHYCDMYWQQGFTIEYGNTNEQVEVIDF